MPAGPIGGVIAPWLLAREFRGGQPRSDNRTAGRAPKTQPHPIPPSPPAVDDRIDRVRIERALRHGAPSPARPPPETCRALATPGSRSGACCKAYGRLEGREVKATLRPRHLISVDQFASRRRNVDGACVPTDFRKPCDAGGFHRPQLAGRGRDMLHVFSGSQR